MRKEFRVSTKAAIFNEPKTKVVVISMGHDADWGLPGGHIEEDETPDITIARELYEECGVELLNLSHRDFFMHSNGKIILAYSGTAKCEELCSAQNNLEGEPKWLTKVEFENLSSIEPCYKQFVLGNWN